MTDPPEKVKICQNDRSIPKLLLFYVQQPFGLMFTFFFLPQIGTKPPKGEVSRSTTIGGKTLGATPCREMGN